MPGVISDYESASFVVLIDGADAPEDLYANVLKIVVDTSLYLPDMFTISLYDDTATLIDDPKLDIGKKVEIKAGDKLLIEGEITSLEPEYAENGRLTILIRGYDPSHRLHRGRLTRTFVDQKDSDVVQKIAKEANLKASADATTIKHKYLIQNNQTNMEFLLMRAELLGYQVFVSEGKLHFLKGPSDLGAAPELHWRMNLRSFKPRLRANDQTDEAIVMGWDPNKKAVIKGSSKPVKSLTPGGVPKSGGDATKAAFGAAQNVVTRHPVATIDEANALAKSIAEEMSRDFIEAEGVSFGDPDLKPGYTVTISGVGKRFEGKYFITSAVHVYAEGDYDTHFTLSGRRPDTITELLSNQNHADYQQGKMYGLVTGLVTNNKDEDGLGRVKVKFPWLSSSTSPEIDSHWARLATPMAGQNKKGAYFIPEVDDEVLVGFEHGDMRFPYIVGVLWNKTDQPPLSSDDVVAEGKTNKWIIQSRTGHVIILDDTDGKEQILVQDKTKKNKVLIDSKENSMTITVDKDLSIEAGGEVSIKAGGKMTLDCQGFTLKAQQSIEASANQNVQLKANASGSFEAKAMSVKGSMSGELDGGQATTVKGTLVNVNGSGAVTVKGNPIALN